MATRQMQRAFAVNLAVLSGCAPEVVGVGAGTTDLGTGRDPASEAGSSPASGTDGGSSGGSDEGESSSGDAGALWCVIAIGGDVPTSPLTFLDVDGDGQREGWSFLSENDDTHAVAWIFDGQQLITTFEGTLPGRVGMTGDIDGDGRDDVALHDDADDTWTWRRGTADGDFDSAELMVDGSVYGGTLLDATADGRADLIESRGFGLSDVRRGDGLGNFWPGVELGSAPPALLLSAELLSEPGAVMVTFEIENLGPLPGVTVLSFNAVDRAGAVTESYVMTDMGAFQPLHVVDRNGDGRWDVLAWKSHAPDEGSYVVWLDSDGSGWTETLVYDDKLGANFEVADFDLDGDADLFFADETGEAGQSGQTGQTGWIRWGEPGGELGDPQTVDRSPPGGVPEADLDLDGRIDVVKREVDSSALVWHIEPC